jgi:dihydrofolate reductase
MGQGILEHPKAETRPGLSRTLERRAYRALVRGEAEPLMTELIIDFITSLDGYGAAEGWPGWWGLEGPEYLAWLGDQPEEAYTILMGATTYRLMYGFASSGEPGTDSLANVSKIVFSSSLTDPLEWANSTLVTQDPVEAVREMKASGARYMRTLGSLTLCRSLLSAGLVDRFRVVVFPVITGSTGRDRIYDGYPDVALEMVKSHTFDGRLQLLEYLPTVLTGPPGTTTDA